MFRPQIICLTVYLYIINTHTAIGIYTIHGFILAIFFCVCTIESEKNKKWKKYLIMCIMRVWVNSIMTAMCMRRFGGGGSKHLRRKPLQQRPAV